MIPMLEVKDLHVSVANTEIIKGLNLKINPGEVHVIMGQNGSGKSTFANVLARHKDYAVTAGSIEFDKQDLLSMDPEVCARAGVFLSFQYPVAIPGVTNIQFIKASVNAVRKFRNMPTYDAIEFLQLVKEKMSILNIDQDFMYRSINDGFSGGEKKRNEILQMILLEPKLAILDETDSGLDIDALKDVANGINAMRDPARSFLIITHYQRLLDYITPDFVHIMSDGKLIFSGDKTLPNELESKGYAWIKEKADE